jgi:hypothetical protein
MNLNKDRVPRWIMKAERLHYHVELRQQPTRKTGRRVR